LLASLREVGWRKGDHWVDIAGNFTPGGVFSVKGTKEVAYAVFNALTDPENGSNKRVRTGLATDEGSSPRAPTHQHGHASSACSGGADGDDDVVHEIGSGRARHRRGSS
jgi:hypothetical protein